MFIFEANSAEEMRDEVVKLLERMKEVEHQDVNQETTQRAKRDRMARVSILSTVLSVLMTAQIRAK
jgi:hypothetical protein